MVVNELATFSVDAVHAGIAELDVSVVNDVCKTLPVNIESQTATPGSDAAGTPAAGPGPDAGGSGVYQCSYRPRDAVKHSVIVTYGHVAVPHSPFKVCHIIYIHAYVDTETDTDVSLEV